MPPKWARLIRQHHAEGHLGLTIPFLIGAVRDPLGGVSSEDRSFVELYTLLQSMRDETAGDGRTALIFECQNLLEPVVTLSTGPQGDRILGPSGATAKLYVGPWFETDAVIDFAWLFENLWDRYRQPLAANAFSFRRRTRQFEAFDANDVAFIARALEVDADDT